MRLIFNLFLLYCLYNLPMALASDPDIAQLQNQLTELSIAIDEMPIGNSDLSKQYIKQLSGIADALKQVTQKNQQWKDAATEYNRLNSLAAEKGLKAPVSIKQQPVENIVLKSSKQLHTIENTFQTMPAGDHQTGEQLLEDLSKVEQQLNAAQYKHHPAWLASQQECLNLHKAITQKSKQIPLKDTDSTAERPLPANTQSKLIRFKKQADATLKKIQQATDVDLTNDAIVANLTNLLKRHRNVVSVLQPQSHSNIVALQQQLDQTEQLLNKKLASSASSTASFGDVRAKLDEIDQNLQHYKVPEIPKLPLTPNSIDAYSRELSVLQQQVDDDLAYLHKIQGKTHDADDVNISRLLFWVGKLPDEISSNRLQTQQKVDNWVGQYTRQLDFLNATDIHNPAHKANRLLGRGQLKHTLSELTEGLQAIELAKYFDNSIKRQTGPDRTLQSKQIHDAMRAMQYKFDQALAENVMPQTEIKSDKLLSIASEVLSRPNYRINPIEHMVIKENLSTRKKLKKVWQNEALNTTTYQWEQFEVITAELVDSQYFLFTNQFKFFLSGDNTTILKRWMLSYRKEGMQILKHNIHPVVDDSAKH